MELSSYSPGLAIFVSCKGHLVNIGFVACGLCHNSSTVKTATGNKCISEGVWLDLALW